MGIIAIFHGFSVHWCSPSHLLIWVVFLFAVSFSYWLAIGQLFLNNDPVKINFKRWPNSPVTSATFGELCSLVKFWSVTINQTSSGAYLWFYQFLFLYPFELWVTHILFTLNDMYSPWELCKSLLGNWALCVSRETKCRSRWWEILQGSVGDMSVCEN